MIAFDNGPAGGDYVRYIDDLMARAARAAPAVVASDGDMASDVDALIRERAAAAEAGAGAAWSPTAPNAVRRPRPPVVPSTSGFATPAVASPAAVTAAAIASALMSGQVGRRAAPSPATLLALAAFVGGLLLIVVGLLWQPFNVAGVIAGIALIGWAARRLKAVVARAARTRTT